MGCSSCGSKSGSVTPQVHSPQQGKVSVRSPKDSNCSFSGGILRIWYNKLKCVKDSNKLYAIGLTEFEANSYLGYIQSALNYPDNYCHFTENLTDYQTNILPRIIANVQSC